MCKKEPWKVLLADAVVVAQCKLSLYYSSADGARGQIYNGATVLDPSQRLGVYKSPGFDPKLHWQYEKDFRQSYEKLFSHLDEHEERTAPPPLSASQLSFTALAASRRKTKTAVLSISIQLDDYLRSDPTDDNDPLTFWHSRSDSAPGLAHMAKDVLAVAIAGVGVERVFSAARRVCSY